MTTAAEVPAVDADREALLERLAREMHGMHKEWLGWDDTIEAARVSFRRDAARLLPIVESIIAERVAQATAGLVPLPSRVALANAVLDEVGGHLRGAYPVTDRVLALLTGSAEQ